MLLELLVVILQLEVGDPHNDVDLAAFATHIQGLLGIVDGSVGFARQLAQLEP